MEPLGTVFLFLILSLTRGRLGKGTEAAGWESGEGQRGRQGGGGQGQGGKGVNSGGMSVGQQTLALSLHLCCLLLASCVQVRVKVESFGGAPRFGFARCQGWEGGGGGWKCSFS